MKLNRKINLSPEYLALLLESSNEGVYACDNNFKTTYSNKRVIDLHGYPENVPPEEWHKYVIICELDGTTVVEQQNLPLYRALRGEIVKDKYLIVKRKDLGSVLVKYNARPLLDDDDEKVGAIITAEDSQDLAHSIARFKTIFEQSPLSIQILDKSGKTILVNSAFRKLWEFSEEFINEHILKDYNILEDQGLEKAGRLAEFKKAFEGETVHLKEFLYDQSEMGFPGRSRWTKSIVYPLKDALGEVQEVVIIHQDVTDQRAAIDEQERILSQLEAIVKQMPAGIMVNGMNGEIELINEQMYKMLETPERAKDVFSKTISKSLKGEVVQAEVKVINPSGTVSVFSTNAGPIQNADGKITSSVLISTDISQEKRAESSQAFLTQVKSLLISTIDYHQILDRIAGSAIPYLADGCMVDILEGDGIKRVLTKHRDPYTQGLMDELQRRFPPRMDSPQPSARAMRTGRPELLKDIDIDLVQKNTFDENHALLIDRIGIRSHMTIPLQIRGKIIGALSLFVCEGRPRYDEKDFSVAQELGRHASVAIDNAKLYRDAKSAIQLRDDFISIASHELRTPITSLNLQLEVLNNLVQGLKENDDSTVLMRKFMSSTNNQLRRLTRLVDDMLDISRISTGKLTLNFKKINVAMLAHDVLERFKDQLRAMEIEHQFIGDTGIYCECDSERIDQVITNFMTNAIRYGGKKPIHVIIADDEHHVYIRVKDHGRGISKSDQGRIFKRFERAHTEEDVSGLGLGLYINTKIIEEHKGKIFIDSEPGKGSTFSVQLPKVRA